MLRLDSFSSAEIYVRNETEGDNEDLLHSHFTVHYRARDMDSIQRYLTEHAPKMRQKVVEAFGDQIKIHRRILTRIRSDQLKSTDKGHQQAHEELDQPSASQ